jgi:hypothetical protein
MKCPSQVYRHSQRSYQGSPDDLEYPAMDTRKLGQHGTIKWRGSLLFIISSLAGWSVGLKPLANGQHEVCFGRLLLGWLDPTTESFQRADIRPLEDRQQ